MSTNTSPRVFSIASSGFGSAKSFKLWVKKDPGTSTPWVEVPRFHDLNVELLVNRISTMKVGIPVSDEDAAVRTILESGKFFIHLTDDGSTDGFPAQDIYGEPVFDSPHINQAFSGISIFLGLSNNVTKATKAVKTTLTQNSSPRVGTRGASPNLGIIYNVSALDAMSTLTQLGVTLDANGTRTYPGTLPVGTVVTNLISSVQPAGLVTTIPPPGVQTGIGFQNPHLFLRNDTLYNLLQQVVRVGPDLTSYTGPSYSGSPSFDLVYPMIIIARYNYTNWVPYLYIVDPMGGFSSVHDATTIDFDTDARALAKRLAPQRTFNIARSIYGGIGTPVPKTTGTTQSSVAAGTPAPFQKMATLYPFWTQDEPTSTNLSKVMLGLGRGSAPDNVVASYDITMRDAAVRAQNPEIFLGSVYKVNIPQDGAQFIGRMLRLTFTQANDALTISLGLPVEDDQYYSDLSDSQGQWVASAAT